jgi:predicted Fe-Mo cluster-binding NifX family protein
LETKWFPKKKHHKEKKLKIAIPVSEKEKTTSIDEHFGSAQYFAVVDKEHIEFIDRKEQGSEDCAPIDLFKKKGVTQVLVRGMGRGAYQRLLNAGIQCQVLPEDPGSLEQLHRALLEDSLNASSSEPCCQGHNGGGDHHHEGHGHHHHHGEGGCCHH